MVLRLRDIGLRLQVKNLIVQAGAYNLHPMTLNDFNSKVNLPRFVSKLGIPIEDYEFIKIPPFGWFGKSLKTDFVGNIFDFVPPDQWEHLYSRVVESYSDTLDFSIPNSQWAEKQLFKNVYRYHQYLNVWRMSRKEMKTHRARFENRVVYFEDVLGQMGMPGFAQNGMGCLTPAISEKFPKLELDKVMRYRRILVIPTFVTPKHIASLEIASVHSLDDRIKVYVNGEMGWYGTADSPVVGSFNDLKVGPGCTWNRKLDHWMPSPIEISQSVTTSQLIQIWSDARRSSFSTDPIELLLSKHGTEDIQHHLGCLSYEQVQQLERATGESLIAGWIECRQRQFVIHGKTFSRRGGSYYLVEDDDEEQLTNFTMDINEIRKRIKDGKTVFVWCGFINAGNSVVPFELEDRYFTSSYLFTRGVRDSFLNLGLGIPYINQRYLGQIMNIIQLSANGVSVVAES
jgi:hypothetical protein